MGHLPTAAVKNKITKITPTKTHTRSFLPGKCWVSDTKGPMRATSVGGCKYYTVYVDAGSGMKVVRFVNSTDAATQQANFAKDMAWSKAQTGRKVKVFRSDSGSDHPVLPLIVNDMAISMMTMAMLSHPGLAKRWWTEAVNTAVFIQICVPHSSNATTTPIKAFTGHKASLDKRREFGCNAYNMANEPEKRNKLDPKATKYVMMGYAKHQKAYKLYDLEQKKMVTSVLVQFRENVPW
ncbi:hypothetical protein DYB26_011766 [Aphanomyces astaci]|uniref:Integrase catalytic domain-containing protein n=1 Tax=Aphanomyces astaci TaxID=112090 RepID=A0A397D9H0_APHAT|nr:hypothetical protein DYB38_014202 [Aphanomyces astaci]RHY75702.1 hypothetical protein DYB34_012587 [Aphanomyces astaci]RHZ31966.1 hypothetical protein DYB26_011766 [Aphanomyces astaci]